MRGPFLPLYGSGAIMMLVEMCIRDSYGKFRISGEPHATRKGKLAIEAEVYP